MTKPLIDQAVDRFLTWKLPADFYPDGGIDFTPRLNGHPSGTNLLNGIQAKDMLQHVATPLLDRIEGLEAECAASQKVLRRISEDASGSERIRNIAKDALGL